MEFEDCVFKEEICLRGAWLSWVTFKCCVIVHLNAEECKIDCSVMLDGIASSIEATQLSWSDREGSVADSSKALAPAGHPLGTHKGVGGLGLCWVELRNASIGGDVKVMSSQFCVPPPRAGFVSGQDSPQYALDLRGSEIKGSLIAQPGVRAVGGISISNARIAGNVWGNGAELLAVEGSAFFAQNCHIAGNLILSQDKRGNQPFRAIGCVSLFGGEIDGALWMEGAFIQSSRTQPTALLAPHIRVDHTFIVSGSVAGPIWVENARIGSDCELKLSVVGNLSRSSEPELLVDFKNVNVKGSFKINDLRFNEPARRLAENPEERAVVRARVRQLLCYPGWHLIEIICGPKPFGTAESLWKNVTVSLLWDRDKEAILLDGLSARFHELNKRKGVLRLDDTATVEEYVRLFAAHISGLYGPFFLLADVEEAGSELRNHLGTSTRRITTEKITATDNKPERFLIEADVIYASTLYRARFSVTPQDGAVEMEEDSPAIPFVLTTTYFDAPYRIDTDESRRLPPLFSKEWEPLSTEVAEKLLEAAVRRPPPVQEPRARFDLTGAAVKRLEDANGTAVGRSVRLQLEGFRYEQIHEQPAPISQVINFPFEITRTLSRKTPVAFVVLIVFGILHLIAITIRPPLTMVFGMIRRAWVFLRNAKQVIERRLFSFVAHKFLVSRNEEKELGSWQKRLNWLALQYESHEDFYAVDASTFFPQPYDQLAAVLRAQGQFEDSRKILSRKLTLERHMKRSVWLRLAWWFYRLGFDHGLSAGRAFITLLLFIVLGVIAARSANSEGLLVAEASAQASPGDGIPAPTPCSAKNSPTLYAVEEFIPVASLRSAPSCRIRAFDPSRDGSPKTGSSFTSRIRRAATDPRVWRFGEVFYRILGWIILSLSILTFTGVARRHMEK